jgi:ubiquinone/menaquinone biosynthesis C-methylase UbiE
MNNKTDQEIVAGQYRTASNLNARIQLHQRFSVNHYGWQPWIFDQLDFPPQCCLLELGCGAGNLWLENLERIPAGWEITLSDFSAGMLQQAQTNLAGQRDFQFKIVDANALPLPYVDGHFDGVIANHMLYYINDRPALLAEIRRILKPGGRFYCSTIGVNHIGGINSLIEQFDAALSSWEHAQNPFILENGAAQLAPFFSQVSLRRYEDALEVTEAAPLVAYILSMFGASDVFAGRQDQLAEFVQSELNSHGGVIHITKDSGIFICSR